MPHSSIADPSANTHMSITLNTGSASLTQPPLATDAVPNAWAPPSPVEQLKAAGFVLGVSGSVGGTFDRYARPASVGASDARVTRSTAIRVVWSPVPLSNSQNVCSPARRSHVDGSPFVFDTACRSTSLPP